MATLLLDAPVTAAADVDLAPGTEVGARRWPDLGQFYGNPWKGVVLALNDVRAWEGSIAFGCKAPTQEAVDAHVAWCKQRGLLSNSIPVLWDFGSRHVVYWTSVQGEYGVRPYAEDVQAWKAENELRKNRLSRML